MHIGLDLTQEMIKILIIKDKVGNLSLIKAMDDGKWSLHDDENGNFEVLSSETLCREVSDYKLTKDYDKNDLLRASVIHGLTDLETTKYNICDYYGIKGLHQKVLYNYQCFHFDCLLNRNIPCIW